MITARTGAASVVANGTLWVTGGGTSREVFATTELVTENGSTQFSDIPIKLMYHCMVKINETHVLMMGGLQNNDGIISVFNTTYIFDFVTQEWQKGPDLNMERFMHGCGSFNFDDSLVVIVAGGFSDDSEFDSIQDIEGYDSVEFLKISEFSQGWKYGPKLPRKMQDFPILTSPNGQNVITVGGQDTKGAVYSLFTLDCKVSLDSCKWIELAQLKEGRMSHLALWMPDIIDISC